MPQRGRRYPYKLIVSWSSGKVSDYYVDEFNVRFEKGTLVCYTKCEDGTQRWLVLPEGSLTVVENDEESERRQVAAKA